MDPELQPDHPLPNSLAISNAGAGVRSLALSRWLWLSLAYRDTRVRQRSFARRWRRYKKPQAPPLVRCCCCFSPSRPPPPLAPS